MKKTKQQIVVKQNTNILVEAILVKILARLSLKSIARFRSVCKEWKCLIDTDFFRDLYETVSSSSSSVSWSIMGTKKKTLGQEVVGHHGCERWGLTNSLGSFMRHKSETTVRKTSVLSCTDGIVLLYTETIEDTLMYHVVNPLLQQWVQIPLPPHLSAFDVVRLQENRNFTDTGLVTKMEKGIVVGYKIVWILAPRILSSELTFMIYSSDTGAWRTENVRCVYAMFWSRLKYSVSLNGILHWLTTTSENMDVNYVLSYDFYNNVEGNDVCPLIPFPDYKKHQGTRRFRRTITTSAGFLVYCNVFSFNGALIIRVWRLVSTIRDPKSWKLSWKLDTNSSLIGFGADYIPLVTHPLNFDIIYLWSRDKNGLVLLNLRTHKFSLYKESTSEEVENKSSMDGCTMNISGCKEYMDLIYPSYVSGIREGGHTLYFSQYVLPRWLNPLPRLSS